MKNSAMVLGIALVALGAGSFVLWSNRGDAPEVREPDAGDASGSASYAPGDLVWRVENAPDHADELPKQVVSLEARGKTYRVGTYIGCDGRPANLALAPNELSRQTCWFAGGGNDIGVFRENGRYAVKARWTQESGGPEVEAPTEGPFETLFLLD